MNRDAEQHVRGTSRFVADLPLPHGALHAYPAVSDHAHGRIATIDPGPALRLPGVVAVLTARDIPGANQIGGIVADEPALAEGLVRYVGEPVALVVAEDARTAVRAAAAVRLVVDPLPPRLEPDPLHLVCPMQRFELGDVDNAWAACDVIVDGTAASPAQEHVYLETQSALVLPGDGGRLHVHSSTQSPTGVQRAVAAVCGLPMQLVEVDVVRIGGGFGGKEDQATRWAVLCALAAQRTGRAVRLILRRRDDMRMTGKRHPYRIPFRIGGTRDGRILAFDVTFLQNAGAYADLSPAVMQRTLFHCTNSYAVPNVRATAYSCRTNLPPNTAFRGFGGPQGMLAIEWALNAFAEAAELSRESVQRRNLLQEGDEFPYGQRAQAVRAGQCWEALDAQQPPEQVAARIAAFNASHPWHRKGYAYQPICFGISFTNTMLNQASALVHIYTDGSVGVSTAAVEMGQGVNAKLTAIAADALGVSAQRIRIESTNTARVANTTATAASVGTDLNGHAVRLACEDLAARLRALAMELPDGAGWTEVVAAAYQRRISLTSQHHYATPGIGFDRAAGKGHPFAYHVYGTALLEATVDCLRGTYRIDAVTLVHDAGRSIDTVIDRSQIEGALLQGIGWLTCEEMIWDAAGRLVTDSLASYKVPDTLSAPTVDITLLEADNPLGAASSKAIGEPPLMYGIGALFALRSAVQAFRPDRPPVWDPPLTAERVLMALYGAR